MYTCETVAVLGLWAAHQRRNRSGFVFSVFGLRMPDLATPYAYDKKTPNFAQGLDLLRF